MSTLADSDDLLAQILVQARAIARLLAAQMKDDRSQTEIVELLTAGGGIPAKEVAAILGTSPATVVVTLQRLRAKKRKTAISKTEGEAR